MRYCKTHRLVFPRIDMPEVTGMRKNGIKFRKCKKCGGVIKKPESDYFFESLTDDLFIAPKGYKWVEIDAKECKHRNIRVLHGNAKVKKLERKLCQEQ